ncbi:aminoacyl-histidine dipeptidase [Avibacterium paragallinarum]|uniref:aminoacyl-histidine dipeptidase n=1 Tax=Avibacterium paragallinarum TaxID=728 RepID=UPI0021F6BBDC|nr:aminoacyl-histidine dipeptidase [Avibacterium paragallinarum]UXN34818.1 aminoacyl-histidine dipeptidase [Avibacterium paragallinarum]
MSEIQQLQPQLLWKWFDQICAIPHPSYHEEALANFIVNWAKEKQFFVERDEVGNILIRKPATKGMENRPSVVLQAHLDMVPQANEDTPHNFQTDPIQPYIEGEWVTAKGTTLGADNGIGLASALAALEAENLAHPELEVLLTMTEEQGMEGAIGLRPNWLKSQIMINTDTEENGEIYIGCAGGVNADLSVPVQKIANPYAHSYELVLKGLRGGHSGVDIHTGRVNAIKTLVRFLAHLNQHYPHIEFAISQINGGSVRNAIPREAFVTLSIDGDVAPLQSAVENFEVLLKTELAIAEPKLSLLLQPVEKTAQIFDRTSQNNVINLLNALPNGVIRQSDAVKNVVETSLSLGVINTEADQINATILIRSLIESGKHSVQETLTSLAELCGASVIFSGDYPGWEPQPDSSLLSLTHKIYADILGYEPEIKVIHAGLECGLLKKIYPNLDVVSIGPTIINAHSPDEKVHIPAMQTYWELLTKMLANIK